MSRPTRDAATPDAQREWILLLSRDDRQLHWLRHADLEGGLVASPDFAGHRRPGRAQRDAARRAGGDAARLERDLPCRRQQGSIPWGRRDRRPHRGGSSAQERGEGPLRRYGGHVGMSQRTASDPTGARASTTRGRPPMMTPASPSPPPMRGPSGLGSSASGSRRSGSWPGRGAAPLLRRPGPTERSYPAGQRTRLVDQARPRTVEHLSIAFSATLLVVAVAVPLGMILTRPAMRKIAPYMLTVADFGRRSPRTGCSSSSSS